MDAIMWIKNLYKYVMGTFIMCIPIHINGSYNMDKEIVYGSEGSFYYVEPYALIWQNDNYYLIGRFQETDEMRHYRLDRIRGAKISEESFVRQEFHLKEYVDQSFMMVA